MNLEEYKKKALRTDYADYSDFHTGEVGPRLDYGIIGLVTESAKILDLLKKSKKNLHNFPKDKVLEELGDLFWYLNITLDELDVTFEELMEFSIKKIDQKYPKDIKDPLIRGL